MLFSYNYNVHCDCNDNMFSVNNDADGGGILYW